MNWKLMGALIMGTGLLTACGASTSEPAAPPAAPPPAQEPAGITRAPEMAAPGGGAAPDSAKPAAEPAKPADEAPAAKKPIVVHD